MKTLYIECNMGAAGDMLMGALLELHPQPEDFIRRLNELNIPGVEIRAEKDAKHGIVGTNIRVLVGGEEETSRDYNHHHDHNHGHHHDHNHGHHHDHYHDHDHGHHHDHGPDDLSTLPNVTKIISELAIPEEVKQDAIAIYQLIAEAEAKAHGRDVAQVHFHEVGALDAVTDIVGNSLLIRELKPERIAVSAIHVGSGMVKCAHGILPVPAPATAHILQGIPSYSGQIIGELCTPTGAAILKHFGEEFGPQPLMTVEAIGYGLGKKDFAAANMVRAFWGQSDEQANDVIELSCNLDDMTGEDTGFAMEVLFEAGALDVYVTSIQMKKNRPGIMLNCLCRPEQADQLAELILKHTTTFGVRKNSFTRYTLDRTSQVMDTTLGTVRLKRGTGFGVSKQKIEMDDLVQLAREHNLTVDEIRQILMTEID